ncbi:cytochrome P450 [Amycolatopsis vancoresmycina]|uniref:Cytochrome P450 n=1 Tax=Amycolatopsis vancoresmycina DSM 44592 TaxID=1292037 RepID=R1IDQ7_9PSEU|nr:cytochrome P450 [Amycolatopsis vancoresmycina]EOD68509.1 cytochrome P450 [Amycolatopsis vancoresmycina DSM 44592]
MTTKVTETGNESMRSPLPEQYVRREDPFTVPAALVAAAGQGPIAKAQLAGGDPFWLVSGFDEARAVLSDPRFSSDRFSYHPRFKELPEEVRDRLRNDKARAGSFINMDPPEHTRYRKLLTGQFTVRRIRELGARIEEIVAGQLDAMLAKGTTADLMADFAFPVPSLMICELLGVPYADRGEFQERAKMLLRMDLPVKEGMENFEALRAFIQRLIDEKRANPADDLLSGLIHHAGADPALTDDELVNIANLLLLAGYDTTASMLGLGIFVLLQRPDQLAALRDDPSRTEDAVEEMLRYLSVINPGLFRFATEDLEFFGEQIPAGSTVVVSVLATNRNAQHRPDAQELDVTRARGPHLAFGHGVHQCLGQQLARMELQIGYPELLRRLPGLRLAVAPEEVTLRNDMLTFGVHTLPVVWDAP